jgi:hypothetical protein
MRLPPEIDPDYPDGGKVIRAPYAGAYADSIEFQRELIRDMKLESEGKLAPRLFRDPDTGKMLTRAEYFDAHALVLLVIAEVEARAKV